MKEATLPDKWPCPVCENTMLPGITYTIPRPPQAKSCGQLWYPYTGPSGVDGTGVFAACYNCFGTGLVSERRARSRRLQGDRRITAVRLRATPRPEQGTNTYSIDAVGREGGKASTEVKK